MRAAAVWCVRCALLLLLPSAAAGEAPGKLHVLFENIGQEPLALELLQASGPPQQMASMAPGQGGKLGTLRGQRYRLSAPGRQPGLVVVEAEGHVRCWAEKEEVRVYGIWGEDVFRREETAMPDPAIMRQEKLEVVFQNRGTGAVMLGRVTGGGGRRELGEILPGKGKKVRCYWGQRFELSTGSLQPVAVRVEGKGSVRCTEEAGGLVAETSWERLGLDRAWLAHAAEARDACERLLAGHAADARHFCDGRFDARAHLWGLYARGAGPALESWRQLRRREAARREESLRQQPARLRRFTALGHAVREVPGDVLRPLQELWRRRRLKDSVPEPQSSEVLAESDVWMLYVPDELLDMVHRRLRPVVESWAGLPPGDLVPTDAYGARLYRHGAQLHMHVDSGLRAALSVIVHVGHLGLAEGGEEDWPLHIADHAGEVHRLRTEVGQMVLYESATCAHGRPTRYEGREFANVFLHYNPMGWPRAHELKGSSETSGGGEL